MPVASLTSLSESRLRCRSERKCTPKSAPGRDAVRFECGAVEERFGGIDIYSAQRVSPREVIRNLFIITPFETEDGFQQKRFRFILDLSLQGGAGVLQGAGQVGDRSGRWHHA